MHLARRITSKYFSFLFIAFSFQLSAFAQENSPYSRYGLGDLVPNHNIQTRAMGGISAAIGDFQSINSTNPSSYSNLANTIFDMGTEVDVRKLKNPLTSDNFSATNALFSYMQLGFPVKMKKANKKDIFLGFALGIKPVSRINYKIAKFERLAGIDTLATFYEGSGGLNQTFVGTGLRIKNLSLGLNVGYMFGNKNYSTQLDFLNDTVFYHESNSASKTNYGGLSYTAGLQYEMKLKKNSLLRIGAYGSLKQTLKSTNDIVRETFVYSSDAENTRIDSVYESTTSGQVIIPSNLGVGLVFQETHWLVGADLEQTNWKEYRFNGSKDFVKNNWKMRVGAEYLPADATTPVSKYFSFVKYRFGFFYGPDYVNVNGNLPEYGITFGAGFPLKLKRSYYETQSSILNTAIEIGGRGNKQNAIKENIIRVCVGLSLSDLWFRRAKYD